MSGLAASLAIALTAAGPTATSATPEVTGAPAEAPAHPVQPEAATATPTIVPETPDGSTHDIVVTAPQDVPGDPLAALNEKSFEAIQSIDMALVGPISTGYEQGVPKPLRQGLRNFLRNLEEPVIALNYLLQLKPGRAAKSVARFTVNTAMGLGGMFDVAKTPAFKLPYTPNTFGNTFACWGIGSGPYFFLPLIGPTTLRDVIGVGLDRAVLPAVVGAPLDQPYYAIPANVIDSLNDRIDIDDQLNRIRQDEANPYAATRELYLRQRKAEIAAICPKKGEVPEAGLPPRAGKGRD
jgi:phospholipid-binding lipoprotein MlaA